MKQSTEFFYYWKRLHACFSVEKTRRKLFEEDFLSNLATNLLGLHVILFGSVKVCVRLSLKQITMYGT